MPTPGKTDPSTAIGDVADTVLGRPLPTRAEEDERVGPLVGIPILGLGALTSAVYGPEAALTALAPLGIGAAWWLPAVMLPVVVLLVVVAASFAQSVAAYPGEGGAYSVARTNLGTRGGLVTAAALALDYILNVAVGALGAFTMSQAAMTMHWRRRRTPHWRRKLALNAAGATATGAALVVVTISEFADGAWVSVLIVMALVVLFGRVRGYQNLLELQLGQAEPVDFGGREPPLVIVPVSRLDRIAGRALRLAAQLSPRVEAVCVRSSEERHDELMARWGELVEQPARTAGAPVPALVTLTSEYRQFVTPLLEHILARARNGELVVMVPEVVPRRWYHHLTKSHRATLLKAMLRLRGGNCVVVASTSWHEGDRS